MALNTKTAGGLVSPVGGSEAMEKIKILVNTLCSGKKVKAGQIVEVADIEARLLVNLNKAEPVVGEAKKPARKTVKASTRAKK